MSNEIVSVQKHSEPQELSVQDVRQQINLIQSLMKDAMKVDEHYGIIPGCKKPSLLKPGAEKLSMMFRLSPTYDVRQTEMQNGHRDYYVVATLTHAPTGRVMGQGVGSCSTMESKYRYRGEGRMCPECGAQSIIKGRDEFGGGWLCFAKKGGCGKKFKDGDESIEKQDGGKVENPDIADQYNTVLKMAKKRAHVDAVLTVTAASDIFTQDVEDMPAPKEVKTVAQPVKRTETTVKDTAANKKFAEGAKMAESHVEETMHTDNVEPEPEKEGTESLHVTGIIEDVDVKEGNKNGKKWKRYGIKIDGQFYGTFDTEVGDAAVSMKGQEVGLNYIVDGKYKTATEVFAL